MKNFKIILLFFLMLVQLSLFAQADELNNALSAESRELFIQKALELRKEEKYTEAISQLDLILSKKTDDAPILLFKGDLLLQSKQFAEAANTYTQLLPLNFEQSTTQINLSYALFMNHKPAKALQFANEAWQRDSTNTNAVVNHFNALLWNGKTQKATIFLNQQESRLEPDQILVMKARLNTSGGNFNQGLQFYDQLVKTYPNKNYTKEYVEVLIGKKELERSFEALENTRDLFTNNEYQAIERKIEDTQIQNAGTELEYFKDIANNNRVTKSAWWQQKEGLKYRIGARASLTTLTSSELEKTQSRSAGLTIQERWNVSLSGRTDINIQNISFGDAKKFTAISGKQTIEFQPSNRRMYGIFYSSDILNFTASLLEKNIRNNQIGYTTHIMFNAKNGFYSQGSWGIISDQNQRTQFFGSLYHVFSTVPLMKTGVNFSTLHFKNNQVTTYFSPDKYKSAELFTDLSTSLPGLSQFHLKLQTAAGAQKIENNSWELAFRLQSEISLRLNKFEATVKYQTSDVASSNGTGYKYNWLTFRLTWKW